MSLVDLIDAGAIAPGNNKISVVYKGVTYLANLAKDGTIIYQGPSAGNEALTCL